MSEPEVVEVALLQVEIHGEWVTWRRMERHRGEQWNGYLNMIKPSTRIVFDTSPCRRSSDEE